MDKLERLLNLTAALLDTERPLTADQLRRRIDGYPEADASFRRAFERDKDDLREMGIPISVQPVPGSHPPVDGYRIMPDEYYLAEPGLEPDELAAIHLAASAVRLDGLAGAEAIRKLGGRGDVDGDTIAQVPTDPRLAAAFDAVASRRIVEFTYRGERRIVEPARLDFVRGRWYLSGFDRIRDDERNFRLDRIDGPLDLGEAHGFDRRPGSSGLRRQPWELGDEPPRTARILVDADQSAWAVQHVGEPVERRADGSIVLELVVTNEEAFRSFVLTFLDHAEILEPSDLREAMVDWLASIASMPDTSSSGSPGRGGGERG